MFDFFRNLFGRKRSIVKKQKELNRRTKNVKASVMRTAGGIRQRPRPTFINPNRSQVERDMNLLDPLNPLNPLNPFSPLSDAFDENAQEVVGDLREMTESQHVIGSAGDFFPSAVAVDAMEEHGHHSDSSPTGSGYSSHEPEPAHSYGSYGGGSDYSSSGSDYSSSDYGGGGCDD